MPSCIHPWNRRQCLSLQRAAVSASLYCFKAIHELKALWCKHKSVVDLERTRCNVRSNAGKYWWYEWTKLTSDTHKVWRTYKTTTGRSKLKLNGIRGAKTMGYCSVMSHKLMTVSTVHTLCFTITAEKLGLSDTQRQWHTKFSSSITSSDSICVWKDVSHQQNLSSTHIIKYKYLIEC